MWIHLLHMVVANSCFTILTFRSRKQTELPQIPLVNLISGLLFSFKRVWKVFKFSLEPHHKTRQLSQYRPKYISEKSDSIVSNKPLLIGSIAMQAYEQELTAPATVPLLAKSVHQQTLRYYLWDIF